MPLSRMPGRKTESPVSDLESQIKTGLKILHGVLIYPRPALPLMLISSNQRQRRHRDIPLSFFVKA